MFRSLHAMQSHYDPQAVGIVRRGDGDREYTEISCLIGSERKDFSVIGEIGPSARRFCPQNSSAIYEGAVRHNLLVGIYTGIPGAIIHTPAVARD